MKGQHRSTVSRFASAKIDTSQSVDLNPDHPALTERRTIFPKSVVGTDENPRFLVSGHNNPKLGKTVLKGPRTGWPIFHITLQERATCPPSCGAWKSCYGNAMPYSRRQQPDAAFIPTLKAEVLTSARANPKGILIRLHALGDFYSTEYVEAWAQMLAEIPQLHVFGYTARTEDEDDAESRRIARMLRFMSENAWDRFAIRLSRPAPGPRHSIIVDTDPLRPDVIVCPAQVEKTTACATCGLCWAANAQDKTIAFLRHGMKRRGNGLTAPKVQATDGVKALAYRIEPDLVKLATDRQAGLTVVELGKIYGVSTGVARSAATVLNLEGRARFVRRTGAGGSWLIPLGFDPAPAGLSAQQETVLAAMVEISSKDLASTSLSEVGRRINVDPGCVAMAVDALITKGRLALVERGQGRRMSVWRVLAAPNPIPATTVAHQLELA